MKSKMTIGKKLFLSFGGAVVLTLAVAVVSLNGIGDVGGVCDQLAKVTARKQFLASGISNAVTAALAAERGILVRAFMKDRPTMEQYNRDFAESAARAKKGVEDLSAMGGTAEDSRGIEELGSALTTIQQGHSEFWSHADSGQVDTAVEDYRTKTNPAIKQAVKTAEALMAREGDLIPKAAQDAGEHVSRARWMTLVLIAFSLLLAVVVVTIVRQINRALRQAVADLSEGSDQMSSAASQVSSSSQSLAQGSSEQAASLEETSASSEEINSMARKNTENSRSAADLVSQSQQKFVETNQRLEQTVVAMGEINTQSGKISKIIKVIDEIAFQTNILALNAAVEAARAGEAGMGFAVVADEVRNLAQRCAQAAKDTSALIEESITKSNDGKTKVDQVATAIHEITEESSKVKTLVDEVNLGSQEQARGIEQIAKAITQMEQVTQKTAANAEESASAAEELNAQSESLKGVVGRLTALVGAGEAANGEARQTRRRTAAAGGTPQRRPGESKPSGSSQRRPGESAAGLAALRKAVSNQPRPVAHPASASAGRDATQDPFPMEEQFKEF
jgi:methyl-accepting chemotaxis protein/methyl-accepting chemotaxis protein-1 (serine sensor receptor)